MKIKGGNAELVLMMGRDIVYGIIIIKICRWVNVSMCAL